MPVSRPWKIRENVTLYWHTWDDETVVYNSGSGDTHQFDPTTIATLQYLEKTSASPLELVEYISSAFEVEQDDGLFKYVEIFLLDMMSLGLIEQAK